MQMPEIYNKAANLAIKMYKGYLFGGYCAYRFFEPEYRKVFGNDVMDLVLHYQERLLDAHNPMKEYLEICIELYNHKPITIDYPLYTKVYEYAFLPR